MQQNSAERKFHINLISKKIYRLDISKGHHRSVRKKDQFFYFNPSLNMGPILISARKQQFVGSFPSHRLRIVSAACWINPNVEVWTDNTCSPESQTSVYSSGLKLCCHSEEWNNHTFLQVIFGLLYDFIWMHYKRYSSHEPPQLREKTCVSKHSDYHLIAVFAHSSKNAQNRDGSIFWTVNLLNWILNRNNRRSFKTKHHEWTSVVRE